MKQFSQKLANQVANQLQQINDQNKGALQTALAYCKVYEKALHQLQKRFTKSPPATRQAQIDFFKNIKPSFTIPLIYHTEHYLLLANQPLGSKKRIKKYFKSQLVQLDQFLSQHQELCSYLTSGSAYADNLYFLQNTQTIKTVSHFYTAHNPQFGTAYDQLWAQIQAKQKLVIYIEEQLGKPSQSNLPKNQHKKPQWTASKVALVELIYALQAAQTLNHGSIELKEIVAFFEDAFQIQLGQYHRIFLEIRERKNAQVKFLTQLQNHLTQKMQAADA